MFDDMSQANGVSATNGINGHGVPSSRWSTLVDWAKAKAPERLRRKFPQFFNYQQLNDAAVVADNHLREACERLEAMATAVMLNEPVALLAKQDGFDSATTAGKKAHDNARKALRRHLYPVLESLYAYGQSSNGVTQDGQLYEEDGSRLITLTPAAWRVLHALDYLTQEQAFVRDEVREGLARNGYHDGLKRGIKAAVDRTAKQNEAPSNFANKDVAAFFIDQTLNSLSTFRPADTKGLFYFVLYVFAMGFAVGCGFQTAFGAIATTVILAPFALVIFAPMTKQANYLLTRNLIPAVLLRPWSFLTKYYDRKGQAHELTRLQKVLLGLCVGIALSAGLTFAAITVFGVLGMLAAPIHGWGAMLLAGTFSWPVAILATIPFFVVGAGAVVLGIATFGSMTALFSYSIGQLMIGISQRWSTSSVAATDDKIKAKSIAFAKTLAKFAVGLLKDVLMPFSGNEVAFQTVPEAKRKIAMAVAVVLYLALFAGLLYLGVLGILATMVVAKANLAILLTQPLAAFLGNPALLATVSTSTMAFAHVVTSVITFCGELPFIALAAYRLVKLAAPYVARLFVQPLVETKQDLHKIGSVLTYVLSNTVGYTVMASVLLVPYLLFKAAAHVRGWDSSFVNWCEARFEGYRQFVNNVPAIIGLNAAGNALLVVPGLFPQILGGDMHSADAMLPWYIKLLRLIGAYTNSAAGCGVDLNASLDTGQSDYAESYCQKATGQGSSVAEVSGVLGRKDEPNSSDPTFPASTSGRQRSHSESPHTAANPSRAERRRSSFDLRMFKLSCGEDGNLEGKTATAAGPGLSSFQGLMVP